MDKEYTAIIVPKEDSGMFSESDNDDLGFEIWYLADPETVCEYTGVSDKNGKKIFENDTVAFMDAYYTDNGYAEAYCIGHVFWSEEELCFGITSRLSAESWEVLQECFVVWNILDNLGLLKGDIQE